MEELTRRAVLRSAAVVGATATVATAAAPVAAATAPGGDAPSVTASGAAAAEPPTTYAVPDGAAGADRRPAPSYPACDWTDFELRDRRWVMAAGMTEDEADCWELVNRAAAKFFSLPVIHPSYLGEVVTAIHELQEKLLMRPTYRRYLEEAGA